MSNTVLRLAGIEKVYNSGKPSQVDVLRALDLQIDAGEVVALIAPSGAGKSTLLHIAGLLDRADAGTVEVANQNLSDASERMRTDVRRGKIGFIYQFHHLLPEFTAEENVMMPQLANGVGFPEARSRAKTLLDRVGLAHRQTHRPAALSGGEQQRVAFCRAMANAPNLLLADEPTGNLDPATSDIVFETLLDLAHETKLAALIATHNPALARRMDRIVKLEAGKIVPVDPDR